MAGVAHFLCLLPVFVRGFSVAAGTALLHLRSPKKARSQIPCVFPLGLSLLRGRLRRARPAKSDPSSATIPKSFLYALLPFRTIAVAAPPIDAIVEWH